MNNKPTPVTISATVHPVTIEVYPDWLDPETLKHEGHEAAVREAAHAVALEIIGDGFLEIEVSVGARPCPGTYVTGYGETFCDTCGDVSNSEPGLPCGRLD